MSNENVEKVADFLAEAGVFFLSTVDDGKPKCRPIGLCFTQGGQLYSGVGTFKEVYRQMQANPAIEIVACKGAKWLRLQGTAVFEQDYGLAEALIAKTPFLQGLYNEETGHKLGVFHLENATAQFIDLMTVSEEFTL